MIGGSHRHCDEEHIVEWAIHQNSSAPHDLVQNTCIAPIIASDIPNSFWKVKPDLPEESSGLTIRTGGLNQNRKIPIATVMTPPPRGRSQWRLAEIDTQNKIPSSTSTTPMNCWKIRTVVSVVFSNILLVHIIRENAMSHTEGPSLPVEKARSTRQTNSSILFCIRTLDRSNSQPSNSHSL